MLRWDFPPGRPLQIAAHQMMVWLRGIGSRARGILTAWQDAHVALERIRAAPIAYDYLNRVFRRIHLRVAAPLRPQPGGVARGVPGKKSRLSAHFRR